MLSIRAHLCNLAEAIIGTDLDSLKICTYERLVIGEKSKRSATDVLMEFVNAKNNSKSLLGHSYAWLG